MSYCRSVEESRQNKKATLLHHPSFQSLMEAKDFENSVTKPTGFRRSFLLEVGSSEEDISSPHKTPSRRRLSPIGDESVRGYTTDVRPKYHGAREMVSVVEEIESLGASCCMMGEAALIYYGARRVMFDWIICVPTERLDEITAHFNSIPHKYEPFRPNLLSQVGNLVPHYPRFKLVGIAAFFVIMTSQACHLNVAPETIEYDRWIRIPYPTLSTYAQALLDTWKVADLEDLIDGMNLTIEWGEQNLDLSGIIDQSWACWREKILAGQELTDDELPRWQESKRAVWTKSASSETKQKRQGWKSKSGKVTRFWTAGQQDPREKPKDYS